MSPPTNNHRVRHQEQTTEGVRKRVGKACDRCRLKKSKCDGLLPCQRCLVDDQICVFSERKRSKDKTYPKGYVELLESRTQALADAIYRLIYCQQHGIDVSQLIPIEGGIVINDVLARLDFLKNIPKRPDNESYADDLLEKFIEDQRARQNSVASDQSGTVSSRSSCDEIESPVIEHLSPDFSIASSFKSHLAEPAKLALLNQLPAIPSAITPSLLIGENGFGQSPLTADLEYSGLSNDQLLGDVAWY